MRKGLLFAMIQGILLAASAAQVPVEDSLAVADLPAVTVTAYRMESTDLLTPLAVTTIGGYRLQHGQQALALSEALSAVPGVFVQNAENFAQDVRVSIRGFGARAAFGIRGVKILVDGFPETTPDGQGQVDNLDPADLTSLQSIRGTASGLYGNASGGVLNFTTLQFSEKSFAELTAKAGSYDFRKFRVKTGGSVAGKLRYLLSSSFTRTDGYREQSAMKNYLVNGGLLLPLDSTARFVLALNYANSPLAQDAGAITKQQALESPRSARDANIRFDADEHLQQGRAGISFVKNWKHSSQSTARVFHTSRRFSNKLAFRPGGIVDLQRRFTGGNLSHLFQKRIFRRPWQLLLGCDIELQLDERKRFDNLDGDKGNLTFDQTEEFFSTGIYLAQSMNLSARWLVNASLRYDYNRLKAADKFLADGDDTGEQNYHNLNPILGITYALSEESAWYGSISTGFETPALSELSANPLPGGGFNADLKPQSSMTFETGTKGFIKNIALRYELALFYIRLKDEFVPFELPAFPGRTFYRNAASSSRLGAELGVGCYLGKGFYTYLNYSCSHFLFTNYTTAAGSFDDNRQPGIPRHSGYLEVRYFKSTGLYGVLQIQYTGFQYADDGNMEKVDSYFTGNFRLGYLKQSGKWRAEPFFGVNNLFGSTYFSNIRINAAAGRYYERAAPAHVFGGLKVGI